MIHRVSYAAFVVVTLMVVFMGGLDPFGRDALAVAAAGGVLAVYSCFIYLLVTSDTERGAGYTLLVFIASVLVAAITIGQWSDGDFRKLSLGPGLYMLVLSPLVLISIPFSAFMLAQRIKRAE